MEFQHECIVPDKGFPFKLFEFEGKEGNYVREKHWHRSVEIFAVFAGELDFYINDKRCHIGGGEFVIVNSNELHSIHASGPNTTLVLQIPLGQFAAYYNEEQLILFSHSPREQDEQIMELIRSIHGCMDPDVSAKEKGYDFKALGLYYTLLYTLVSKYRKKEISTELVKKVRGLNRLSLITSYLVENYDRDITLESLARTFGYSPEHLSRMFQKYAGVNFKTYLQNVRLEYARKELAGEGSAIGEIAVNLGFADSRAMAKAFKKRYGILPSVYRESVRGKN